jgi:hypothetical protein
MPNENKVQLTITLNRETAASLRSLLGENVERPEQVSRYLERAVARDVLIQTVRQIQDRNRHLDSDEVEREVDKAVREVRQERRARVSAQDSQA